MSRKFEQYLKKTIKPKHTRFREQETLAGRLRAWKNRVLPQHIKKIFRFITAPAAIYFLLYSRRINPAYNMGWNKRIGLGFRMWRNTYSIFTGSSFRAHLLIARKILEMPPTMDGIIVECGCFKGGSSANLSLICELTGRKLVIYDSFAGLPDTREDADPHFHENVVGMFAGPLAEVKANISRHGCIAVCEFRQGLFKDTLPDHKEKIVAMFLDVDYQSSLHECIINLWPHLHPKGYVFIDEYVHTDYCSLFYSEKYWEKYFHRAPPGLIGAGSGVPLGEFYFGPIDKKTPLESMTSIAYTRKDFEAIWRYFPDEEMQPQPKRHLW